MSGTMRCAAEAGATEALEVQRATLPGARVSCPACSPVSLERRPRAREDIRLPRADAPYVTQRRFTASGPSCQPRSR
jgi:hypothetical protein